MTRSIDPDLAESDAAQMLSAALSRASNERGLSLRKIAPLVGYKQAVVLSHMATGRVPIPVEKAEKLAEVLGIDPGTFLKAILKQRHPEVSWSLVTNVEGEIHDSFEEGLALGLGQHGSRLNEEQVAVMREMAADPHPRRRWLSVEEAAAIEMLRGSKLGGEPTGEPATDRPPALEGRNHNPE